MNKELEGLITFAKSQGYKVKFVGNKILHDYAALNPAFVELTKWQGVPKKTFEVDKNEPAVKQTKDLRHDELEFGLMKAGVPYGIAHPMALEMEKYSITPREIDALWKIGDYRIVQIHDDGDLTIKSKGIDYVVTTEGQTFKGTLITDEFQKKYGGKAMPAVSEKQRRFAGAELGRLRAGKPRQTTMTEKQLEELAEKKDNAREEKTERKTMRRSGKLRISQRPPRITNHRMHIMR